jgi:large subunit ribosomal protein L30
MVAKKKNEKETAQKKTSVEKKEVSTAAFEKLALIRIRGMIHVKTDIKSTIFNLRLRKNNVCVVIENTPANRAAAAKCKDYIAYGEINKETYDELVDKRGKKDENGVLKKFFLMHPPIGGFERKGIKKPFSTGGALGYRGNKMNELIMKML